MTSIFVLIIITIIIITSNNNNDDDDDNNNDKTTTKAAAAGWGFILVQMCPVWVMFRFLLGDRLCMVRMENVPVKQTVA